MSKSTNICVAEFDDVCVTPEKLNEDNWRFRNNNKDGSQLLPEFVKKANVAATSRSEINLCEPIERKSGTVYARVHKRKYVKQFRCIKPWASLLTFCFDQDAVPSLYTDSMNLVHQQRGDLSQSNNVVTTS